MSLPDLPTNLVDRIARSLRASAAQLQDLRQRLVQRRGAWMAIRATALAEPVHDLDRLARELAAEDTRRRELLTAAAASLPPLPGVTGHRHVNVSALLPHLPPAAAAHLREAARLASDAARAVRTEIALGERLLRFSQRAHEGLLGNLGSAIANTADDVGSYDRNARRLPVALTRGSTVPGSLVDGRM